MALGLKRYRQLGHLHFVTFCCYLRRMHLETPEARGLFEESLERIRRRDDFQVIGYVVMPVLIHLLVSEPGKDLYRQPYKQSSSQWRGGSRNIHSGRRGITTSTYSVKASVRRT
jgi:REP element-mobilizing transposase RayT